MGSPAPDAGTLASSETQEISGDDVGSTTDTLGGGASESGDSGGSSTGASDGADAGELGGQDQQDKTDGGVSNETPTDEGAADGTGAETSQPGEAFSDATGVEASGAEGTD